MYVVNVNPFIAYTDRFIGHWDLPVFEEYRLFSSLMDGRHNILPTGKRWRECNYAFDGDRLLHILQGQIYEAIKQEFYLNDPLTNYEVLELCEYRRGGCFAEHSDNMPWMPYQRLATATIFVTDNFEGGETKFTWIHKTVLPKAGRLLYFRYEDYFDCTATTHEEESVRTGIKRTINQYIGKRPLPC